MGEVVKAGRVSRTVIKPEPGFRAELPGLDLPTLVQMTCARRERLVVRVSSYGEEGFLYSAEGRLLHATVGELVGEEAVLRILSWPAGDFAICERPFPLHPTIETSTEGLLLRSAQRADEAAHERDADIVLDFVLDHDAGLAEQLEGEEEDDLGLAVDELIALPTAPARPSVPPPPPPSVHPAPPVAWPLGSAGPAPLLTPPRDTTKRRDGSNPTPTLASLLQARPPHEEESPTMRRSSRPPPPGVLGRSSEQPRASTPPPVPAARPASRGAPTAALRLPPLPPPARKSSVPDEDTAVIASVRIDMHGEVVGAFGGDDQLAQLVAYVSRIATLVQCDFALDPFEALHAELAGKRVLIYHDDNDLVGVVMRPSSAAQELRQRLGV
jgi:hypothetical protein